MGRCSFPHSDCTFSNSALPSRSTFLVGVQTILGPPVLFAKFCQKPMFRSFCFFSFLFFFWDTKIGWQLCACGYAGTLWAFTAVRRTHPASGLGSVPQKLSTFYLHGWVILARANAQSVHFNGWRWRWNAPFQSFVRSLTWQNPSRASYRGEAKKGKKKLQNKKKRKWNNDMSHKYSPNLSTFGKERQDRM